MSAAPTDREFRERVDDPVLGCERWPEAHRLWPIDPDVTFLNHGSFGATPLPVLEQQTRFRDELEREPVTFLFRKLPDLLDESRARAGAFLGADPENLVFVPNATTGVNTVVRSLTFEPGDEILATNHGYYGITCTLQDISERTGATLVTQPVPITNLNTPDDLVHAITAGLTDRTKLVVLDQIASPTGLIFPVKEIARLCRERGVMTMIDAAHVPGEIPVDVESLGVDFWTGNFHKWAFTPKTVAVLWVRPDFRDRVHPVVTSLFRGMGFHAEFDWVGTYDPTAYVCIPAALDFIESLGGLDRIRRHNEALARYGLRVVSEALGTTPPIPADPPDFFSSMAMIALPEGVPIAVHPDTQMLMNGLYEQHGIEMPFTAFDGVGYARISAQVYNKPSDYDRLAEVLPAFLEQYVG